MGWRALYKDGTEFREETHGRPVQDGEEGKLLVIAQEDFGHTVAVDLVNGIIALDYERLAVQNGSIELENPKAFLWICDETNIVGELRHLEQQFVFARDEDNKKILGQDGRYIKVRNDILTPLIWRPIWFTRFTNGTPTKVIGAQTTMPKEQGGKNAKKMVSIFIDGRLGID